MPAFFRYTADKCTVQVFKQFLHWAAMQIFSDEDGPHWKDMKSGDSYRAIKKLLTNFGRHESPLSEVWRCSC